MSGLIVVGRLALGWSCFAGLAAEPEAVRLNTTGKGGAWAFTTPLDAKVLAGNYVLEENRSGGARLFATVFDGAGRKLLAVVGQVPGGDETREWTLRPQESAASPVDLRRQGENVEIRIENQPFTTYRTDAGPKPILFPLLGPDGLRYTRAFPMEDVKGEARDHPHQRSFWFTHGSVNGIDFWSELKGHGSIREVEKTIGQGGLAAGILATRDEWLGPDSQKVCDDERTLTVYNVKDVRILDYDVTILATERPVTFGDTKEGMFGVRVASSMDVKAKTGGRIVNAEGLTDGAAWGKPSPWVDYTGPVEGETVGIAILNHPDSFRHPTTWHVRDYGLFAANPFGWTDFGRKESGAYVLAKGDSLRFRYRLVLHPGTKTPSQLAEFYDAYAHPPRVTVR